MPVTFSDMRHVHGDVITNTCWIDLPLANGSIQEMHAMVRSSGEAIRICPYRK